MKTLITGGAGFVGFQLAKRLLEDGTRRLTLVDNFTRGRQDREFEALIKNPNVEFISGDLSEKDTYNKIDVQYDEVYHLAAVIGVKNVTGHPDETLRVNILSTLFLLEWFSGSGCGKLLFASTSEVYGWTQLFHELPVPTPENVPLALTDLSNPRASYAGSKILGELMITQHCLKFKRPFTIVRYHNIYGPRMGNEHVVPELYHRASHGENPLTVYAADHSRAFCYVSDAVDATIKAMGTHGADYETFNIGNDEEEITIGGLAGLIMRKAGIRVDILPAEAPNDPIRRRCPDISKAKRVLDYRPQVSLDEGLGRTIEWYRNEKSPAKAFAQRQNGR